MESNQITQSKPDATRKLDPIAGRKVPADYPLFAITVVLLAFGLFMVFDASYAHAAQKGITHGDPWWFFKQQTRYAVAGLLAMILAMRSRYWILARHARWILIASIVLLVLVWVPHLGSRLHGAARWVRLGPVQLQPSEVSKLAVVLYLAAYLSKRGRSIRQFQGGLTGALLPVGLVAMLIVKEPDLGTAMVLVVSSLTMMAVAGARRRHLAAVTAAGVVLVAILALRSPYSRQRLLAFVSSNSGSRTYAYQVNESVAALEGGGLRGLGAGQGDAKFFHLPAPYTDFIGSTVGEEFGLIGSLVMLGLFFSFTLRGYQVAHRCLNPFGSLLATGLCTMISAQALLNLAVITKSVPDTGVPLPMISYGGSSLVLALLAVGLILSVSRWPDLRYVELTGASGRRRDLGRTSIRSVSSDPASPARTRWAMQ